nr:MAG TPA: hypothetical protein [Caudoviricetes sp.]
MFRLEHRGFLFFQALMRLCAVWALFFFALCCTFVVSRFLSGVFIFSSAHAALCRVGAFLFCPLLYLRCLSFFAGAVHWVQ